MRIARDVSVKFVDCTESDASNPCGPNDAILRMYRDAYGEARMGPRTSFEHGTPNEQFLYEELFSRFYNLSCFYSPPRLRSASKGSHDAEVARQKRAIDREVKLHGYSVKTSLPITPMMIDWPEIQFAIRGSKAMIRNDGSNLPLQVDCGNGVYVFVKVEPYEGLFVPSCDIL